MPDDFNTLSNRLLTRCPAVGLSLAQQLVNDSWRALQSRRPWSFRRRNSIFTPPTLYQTGTVSTNVSTGQPTLLTGIGTTWTPQMVGRQIRVGGLNNPYYTIVGYQTATSITLDQPWAGPDVVSQTYQILQCFFPVPADFGYFDVVVSIKDAYRLWTTLSQSELGLLDPQRTNQGQTYAISFRDYTPTFNGTTGPVVPVAATGSAPIITTPQGFQYVANATYVIQIVAGGPSGTATYKWMRAGQSTFSPTLFTTNYAVTMMDGLWIYFPSGNNYNAGDLFIINCVANQVQGTPRFELWPAPTISQYLYPYIYFAKEYDLTPAAPTLPPFIANRADVILEMALASCARFPGPDTDHQNVYFNLALATMHETRTASMLVDLERNDNEVSETNITYQSYPLYQAPWLDGSWQQTHAPFLLGSY